MYVVFVIRHMLNYSFRMGSWCSCWKGWGKSPVLFGFKWSWRAGEEEQ